MQISLSFRIVAVFLLCVAGMAGRVRAVAPASMPATTTASEDKTFDDVLARYAAAVKMPDKISFDATETFDEHLIQRGTNPNFNSGPENIKIEVTFHKDGEQRIDVQSAQTNNAIRKGKVLPDPPRRMRFIVLQDRWANCVGSHGHKSVIVYKDRPEAYYTVLSTGHGRNVALDGFVMAAGAKFLSSDLLAGGENKTIRKIERNGKQLYLLTADVNEKELKKAGFVAIQAFTGAISLWVDPARNYVPHRLHFRCQRVDQQYSMDVVASFDSQMIDGRQVPIGVEWKRVDKSKDGRIKETAITYQRKNIVINPIFPPNAFQFDIPDGTPVSERSTGFSEPNPKAPKKEWRNGQVVPVKVLPPVDPNQL